MTITDPRTASGFATSNDPPPPGPDPLGGQASHGAHYQLAAEGRTSPQAKIGAAPNGAPPAGSKTSRSHKAADTQPPRAAADNFPGGHNDRGTQIATAAGERAS